MILIRDVESHLPIATTSATITMLLPIVIGTIGIEVANTIISVSAEVLVETAVSGSIAIMIIMGMVIGVPTVSTTRIIIETTLGRLIIGNMEPIKRGHLLRPGKKLEITIDARNDLLPNLLHPKDILRDQKETMSSIHPRPRFDTLNRPKRRRNSNPSWFCL
jgi:hypothetical protein